jgi:hypothetical protein
MPLYDFRNTVTGEETEEFLSIAEKEQYLLDNPDLIPVMLGSPQTVGGVGEIISKTDNGWKDTLGRIADAHPYSPLGAEHGTKKDAESVKLRNTIRDVRKRTGME